MVIFGYRITWVGFFVKEKKKPWRGGCAIDADPNYNGGCPVFGCGYPKEGSCARADWDESWG